MTNGNGIKVDIQGLHKLYGENSTAQALLDHLAGRERKRKKTTVDRLLTNVPNCSRGSIIAVLKELEEYGCGEFVVGRHTHPSRFEWQVSMVSVGKAAAGEQFEFDDFDGTLSEEDDFESEEEYECLVHSFRLREDFTLELELPNDFSSKEAERLAEYVKTLPFST